MMRLAVLAAAASAFHDCIESSRARRSATLRRGGAACAGGLCLGMHDGPHEGGPASYPVAWKDGAGTSMYSTMTVPGYPAATDGITYYIWTDSFFGDAGDGRMNQFVPQLLLGSTLDRSSGAPDYAPESGDHETYAFGAHYYFELYNTTTNETDSHAAYGDLHPTAPGETLWTSFDLSPGGDGEDMKSPRWTLRMGVLGDPERTSVLVVDRPYMGLRLGQTRSWAEPEYARVCINACWELYGADDAAHLPSTGAFYDLRITQPAPGSYAFLDKWEQDEGGAVCPRTVAVAESHDAQVQHVSWNISVAPT